MYYIVYNLDNVKIELQSKEQILTVNINLHILWGF